MWRSTSLICVTQTQFPISTMYLLSIDREQGKTGYIKKHSLWPILNYYKSFNNMRLLKHKKATYIILIYQMWKNSTRWINFKWFSKNCYWDGGTSVTDKTLGGRSSRDSPTPLWTFSGSSLNTNYWFISHWNDMKLYI